MPFTEAFLPEYDHEMSSTRRVLERLPFLGGSRVYVVRAV